MRIEGHVGQPFARALSSIQQERDEQRLPFDVVALSADLRSARTVLQRNVLKIAQSAGYKLNLAGLSGGLQTSFATGAASGSATSATTTNTSTEATAAEDDGCYVQDLEALYDAQRAEFNALLCAEMQYFYGMNLPALQKETPPALKTAAPAVPLLATCAPAFRIRAGSLGQFFESVWAQWKDRAYTAPDTFLALIGSKRFTLAASALGSILANTGSAVAGMAAGAPQSGDEANKPAGDEQEGAGAGGGQSDAADTAVSERLTTFSAITASASRSFSPGGTGIGTGINLSTSGAGLGGNFGLSGSGIGTINPGIGSGGGITFPGVGGGFPLNPSIPTSPGIPFNPRNPLNPIEPAFPRIPFKPNIPGGIFVPVIPTIPIVPVTPTIRDKDSRSVLLAYLLLYYIQKLSEAMPVSLSAFSAETFGDRYAHLMEVADEVKDLIAAEEATNGVDTYAASSFAAEDIIDHLDSLLYASKDAAFGAVADAYDDRKSEAGLLQSFGYFTQQHPGIAHKGGVPMGGTFILVYHQAATEEDEVNTTIIREAVLANPAIPIANLISVKNRQHSYTGALSPSTNLTTLGQLAAGLGTLGKEAQLTAPPAAIKDSAARITPADDVVTSVSTRLGIATTFEPEVLNLRERTAVIGLTKPVLTTRTVGTPAQNFLNAALANILADRLKPDDTIAKLLEGVADGTVIADFFLPYRCSSNCPPMQFVVKSSEDEEPQAGAPTVKLKTTRFCNDDAQEYPITARPDGGQLAGEGVDAQARVFRPSEVELSDAQASKELTITYTTAGGAGSIKVTVDAVPRAAFRVQTSAASPLAKTFTDLSVHAQSHAWNFGDGEGSTDRSPQHTYKQPGTYTVSLQVVNGVCSATTNEEITAGSNGEPPARKCVPLSRAITAYDDFITKLGIRLATVRKDFPQLAEMDELFSILKKAAVTSKEAQITAFVKKEVASSITRLLEALNGLIVEEKQRATALALYRILAQVMLYLGCMQDEDLDKAAVPVTDLIKTLAGHAKKWRATSAQWKTAEKKAVAALTELLQAEATRLKAAGEKEPKPQYLEALNKCLDQLTPPSA